MMTYYIAKGDFQTSLYMNGTGMDCKPAVPMLRGFGCKTGDRAEAMDKIM